MKELPSHLIHRPCPFCGCERSQHYLTVADHMSDEDFDVVRCEECKGLYLNPAPSPEAIGGYYENVMGHFMTNKPNRLTLMLREQAFALELRPLVRQLGVAGKILEIGAGDGELTSYLKSRGYQSSAYDVYSPDDWRFPAIPYKQVNINELASLGELSVDAVIMRHVLEHVHEPLALLRYFAAQRLRWLHIIVPNTGTTPSRWFGTDWAYWDPPRHLNFFTGQSLTEMARRAGYRPAGASDHGIDEIIVSLFRRQMIRWRRQQHQPLRDPSQEAWWYPWLVPKGIPCSLASALSAPFLHTLLSRVFVLEENP